MIESIEAKLVKEIETRASRPDLLTWGNVNKGRIENNLDKRGIRFVRAAYSKRWKELA